MKIISSTVIVGILYIIFSTTQYESYISLYPNQQDSDTSSIFENISGMVKQMGLLQSGSLQSNIDISDVIFSRRLHKDLISRTWNDQNGNKVHLTDLWKLEQPGFLASVFGSKPTKNQIFEAGIIQVEDRLWVEENLTGLRKIYVKLEDPHISAQMANYIGDYLHNFISNELMFQAKNNRLFLEERTASAEQSLEDSEDELKKFQERYTLAIDDPDIVLQRTRLSRNVNMAQEIYFVLVQQLELAKIEELKHRPIVNFIDRADVPIDSKYPRVILVLFTSFLCGILIASLFAIYREESHFS
ncbi:MAG: hypothetical protein H8E72_00995 [Candidatus Marinimicrobia bacterium]|nr:hypothetical protein [Candidatus Neomarinimicrobiota bacterium]